LQILTIEYVIPIRDRSKAKKYPISSVAFTM